MGVGRAMFVYALDAPLRGDVRERFDLHGALWPPEGDDLEDGDRGGMGPPDLLRRAEPRHDVGGRGVEVGQSHRSFLSR